LVSLTDVGEIGP